MPAVVVMIMTVSEINRESIVALMLVLAGEFCMQTVFALLIFWFASGCAKSSQSRYRLKVTTVKRAFRRDVPIVPFAAAASCQC